MGLSRGPYHDTYVTHVRASLNIAIGPPYMGCVLEILS